MTRARDIAAAATALSVDGTVKLDGNYPVGTNNVALGDTALNGSLTGSENVAVGTYSLDALTSGAYNSGLGYGTLSSTTTGSNNSAVGNGSLISNTSGSHNAALGAGALSSNTTGSNNTAVGYQAGYSNTSWNNCFFGYKAGYENTTGTSLVAIGEGALDANTTANFNIGIGANSLGANTTGASNTAIGDNTLRSNTTASYNTAVGYQALYDNQTGVHNTALGHLALGDATGSYSTTVGSYSGYSITSGTNNTFVGYAAGSNVTTGSKNTILGSYNGNQGGLDIRTSSNRIVLSDGDGNIGLYIDSGGNIRNRNYVSATQGIEIENLNYGRINYYKTGYVNNASAAVFYNSSASGVGSIVYGESSTSYNTSSDYRLKENVVELTGATDRLKQIPVHQFNFINTPDTTVDGFIAHEVQAIVPEAITGTKDEVDADGNPVYQGIDQSKLVPLLVASLKEALTEIDNLKARVSTLEAG